MKRLMAITLSSCGLIGLSIFLAGSRFQSEVTQEQALQKLKAALLESNLVQTDARFTMHRVQSGESVLWQAEIAQPAHRLFTVQFADGSIARITDETLQAALRKNLGTTDQHAFSDDLAARAAAQACVDRFRDGRQVVRTKWSFVQNGLGQPRRRTAASASYAGVIDGYHVVDFVHGCDLTLDSQTGSMITLRQHWVDYPHDAADPRLSEADAKEAAAQYTQTQLSTWQPYQTKLGWALPEGGSRMRLAWKIESRPPNQGSAHNYWVDAKEGTILKVR